MFGLPLKAARVVGVVDLAAATGRGAPAVE